MGRRILRVLHREQRKLDFVGLGELLADEEASDPQQVLYSPDFGPEATFYRWRREASKSGKVVYHRGAYFMGKEPEKKAN